MSALSSAYTKVSDRVPACPVERLLGREHWTRADYLTEGRRLFDKEWVDTGGQPSPFQPGNREQFARAFADVSMPVAKQRAERVRWLEDVA